MEQVPSGMTVERWTTFSTSTESISNGNNTAGNVPTPGYPTQAKRYAQRSGCYILENVTNFILLAERCKERRIN
jgi:hypothetical protein